MTISSSKDKVFRLLSFYSGGGQRLIVYASTTNSDAAIDRFAIPGMLLAFKLKTSNCLADDVVTEAEVLAKFPFSSQVCAIEA